MFKEKLAVLKVRAPSYLENYFQKVQDVLRSWCLSLCDFYVIR